jgi:hypothetical protein
MHKYGGIDTMWDDMTYFITLLHFSSSPAFWEFVGIPYLSHIQPTRTDIHYLATFISRSIRTMVINEQNFKLKPLTLLFLFKLQVSLLPVGIQPKSLSDLALSRPFLALSRWMSVTAAFRIK